MAELKDLIVKGPSVFVGETNVSTPTANTQIANKQYVDNKITYGTSALTAGSSALATGNIYVMYE